MATSVNNQQLNNYSDLMDADLIRQQSTLADTLGIPLNNRFVCILDLPDSIRAQFNDNDKIRENQLRFQVISTDVPNFQLDTNSQELNGMNRYYCKGRTDSDLSITYLENSALSLRNMFFEWMNLAIRINEGGGVVRGYLNEYTGTDIIIAPLDVNGNAWNGDRFTHPFPYAINNIEYNKSTSNEIIKTTVTFKYMYHDIVNPSTRK